MKVMGRFVDTWHRTTIPPKDILSDLPKIFNESLFNKINYLQIYYRGPYECPFGRGNWICDFCTKEGEILFCIKLPRQMSEATVKNYYQPLIDLINARKH